MEVASSDQPAPEPAPPSTGPIAELPPGLWRRRSGRSILDFLTDGSLPALLEQLQALGGARLELRDEQGRLIRYRTGAEGSPWEVAPEAPAPGAGAVRVPLTAEQTEIGAILITPDDAGAVPETLRRAVGFLASAASELCSQELALWHRVQEVELMYRLSSMLVHASRPERVLDEALAMALEVLELDAGSVVLLPENEPVVIGQSEEGLELKASRGLSNDWLESPQPLSRDREFDRLALAGEIVAVADLQQDERVLDPGRCARENLGSFLSAGLVFQGRPIGVFRLYARQPREFSAADTKLLRSVTEQSAVAVEQARLIRVQEQERRMERQLALAADVQQRMLPRVHPDAPGLDLAARSVASHQVGGDFYDIFRAGERVGLVVGDMVGNGIAAALLMASVRASLRAHADGKLAIERVIELVNAAMCRDTLESEFATLWYAEFDPASRVLRYCSAGHEPPFVVRAASPDRAEAFPRGGLVLGIERDEKYEAGDMPLQPGDVVVVFTDGLVEAMNFDRERFGAERIRRAVVEALAQDPGVDASGIIEHVLWTLRQFTGLYERPDDQTILVMRVLG
ncbi:MAG: PP2C family protein-serine/threonine phosphatase [Phycisphaerales bacterium JB037]